MHLMGGHVTPPQPLDPPLPAAPPTPEPPKLPPCPVTVTVTGPPVGPGPTVIVPLGPMVVPLGPIVVPLGPAPPAPLGPPPACPPSACPRTSVRVRPPHASMTSATVPIARKQFTYARYRRVMSSPTSSRRYPGSRAGLGDGRS